MAKKGQQKHLKRFAMPISLGLPRKSVVWAVKPRPGPHPAEGSMPLRTADRTLIVSNQRRRCGNESRFVPNRL